MTRFDSYFFQFSTHMMHAARSEEAASCCNFNMSVLAILGTILMVSIFVALNAIISLIILALVILTCIRPAPKEQPASSS